MIFEPKLGFTEIDIESKISDFQSNYSNTTNSSLFLVDNECYSKGGIIIYNILGKADLSDINPHSNLLKIQILEDIRIYRI
jgi:hypothetical protein